MKLQKITYEDLSAKQKEIYNFQKVAAVLADYGFNCIKLDDDWGGADFLAYHRDGYTIKVQLKARLTIGKHYIDKELWMAFPHRGSWYLLEHDQLVALVEQHAGSWLRSESWVQRGLYNSAKPSVALLGALESARIG